MNDSPDPLETELAALSPRAVSGELRSRVAERLGARPARRWPWALALVAVLAGAGVIALAPPRQKVPVPPVPPAVVPAPPAPVEPDSPAPSVLAYRQALARSPEALDALLDRQAASPSDAGLVPVGTFTRSQATINGFIGDD